MNLKMRNNNFSRKGLLAAAAIFICFTFLVTANFAQTPRRKRNVQPIVSPTVQPTETLPVIISRASDVPNENQIIVEDQSSSSPSAETLDEKLDKFNARMKEINTRLKSLESSKSNEYDEKQKRLLLNLDILTRAEQRAETLRKQLYELIEKENSVKARLEQINNDLRPENIERSAAFAGTLRPEELREQREKSLKSEKDNLESLLLQIQNNRANLETNLLKADDLVEKVRARAEKEIDGVLDEDKENQQ